MHPIMRFLSLFRPNKQHQKLQLAPSALFRNIWNIDEIPTDGYATLKSITWLIPEIHLNSGGLLNIFRFNRTLENLGFTCHFRILSTSPKFKEAELNKLVNDHFCDTKATFAYGVDNMVDSEYFIATYWTTAYYLNKIQTANKKIYFVQDLETKFYPSGCEYAAVETTYKMGFTGITAGTWLSETLLNRYSMRAEAFGFSTDSKIYFPNKNPFKEKVITCYVRKDTTRRGFNTAIQALIIVARKVHDVRVQFVGMDMNDYDLPFSHSSQAFGSEESLAETLRNSRVSLILSYTNASLLPLDSIGCGTPVVYPKGESVDWLMGKLNVGATESNPEALAERLVDFLTDDELHGMARAKGLEVLSSMPTWEEQYIEVITTVFNHSTPHHPINSAQYL